MKTEISSLELHYLLKELQHMISAKIEQIYQIGKEELILQLHVPGTGKRILRIILGKLMYIASNKGDVPEKPPGFCLYLRKKLKNARLRQLNQLGFERIIEFIFETKDAKFKLIVELFSKGNIILCDENNTILSVLERQEWKDRSIKPKETYQYPKKEFNFITITKDELITLLNKSTKENLVKTLALDLGLGGVYAEELCIISNIDKNIKSAQLSDKETDELYKAIKELLSKEPAPRIIYKDAEKTKVKDITPFALNSNKDLDSTEADSFNNAIDSILTKKLETKAIETTEKAAKTRIDKVNEMISQQKQRIKGLEKSEKENKQKAERIYENYQVIEQILAETIELKKKLSWDEIKQRFKGHKIIKDINTKTGEITLEL
jgi:predicted ribosome quality control (RQC) complex YloA/Tae2 family protein